MSYHSLGAGLLLASLLVLPVSAAPRKPGKNNSPPSVDAEKLTARKLTGKLVSTPGTDRSFTLQIQLQQLKLKPDALRPRDDPELRNLARSQRRLLQLQDRLARSRNPARELRQIQEVQQQMQADLLRAQLRPQPNPYQVVTTTQDVTVQAAPDADVRTLVLPEPFDEKGNIKTRYTREELKKLKGKKAHLPGYESSLEDLKVGQVVEVTLAPRKARKPAPNNKDLDKDPVEDAEKKVQAGLIVITSEASAGEERAGGKKPAGRKKL